MAAIDLLPAAGRAVSSKPSNFDAGNEPSQGASDPGNSPFGTVLSDSMRPTSRKDNSSNGRDQSAPSSGTRSPSSAAQPSSTDNRPDPATRADSRRPNGSTKSGKKASDANGSAPTGSPSTSKSSDASSDLTVENEVANVQQDEQQANADATATSPPADPAPQQGAAPAQLVAGLLIASTQPQTSATPTVPSGTPQNNTAGAASAIANVQKAPVGLAAALEQAVTSDREQSAPAAGTPQAAPAPSQEHSTIVNAAPTGAVQPQTPVTPPVAKATTEVQHAVETMPGPVVKAGDDKKNQESSSGPGDTKTAKPQSDSQNAASPASELPTAPATSGVNSTPAPVVQVNAAPTKQSDGASGNDAKPVDDPLARQKSGGDSQSAVLPSRANAAGSASTDAEPLTDLSGQAKLADATAANLNDAIGKGKTGSTDNSQGHLPDDDSAPSTDAANPVQGFATDYGTRRADGTQAAQAAATDHTANPSQVLDQVAHGIQVSHQSGERMQLHLRPPELGNVQIDVSMRDGLLSARLEAQSPATHQLLSDNLSQLKDSLAQQGVQVDRLEVGLSDSMRSDVSTGGFSGRSFEQQQQRDDVDPGWEQAPSNTAPQRRPQVADVRVSPSRGSGGPIMSLDITV